MDSRTIPITLKEEIVKDLEKIAEKEISSRNRIMKIAIINYLKENANPKTK